jgi:hypothetical protein
MKKLWRRIFPTKEMREYTKMYKRHRKTMIKLAKADRDWDYGYLHDLVVAKIKHMYEYYCAGNNIFQSEESLNHILETLAHTIDLAERLNNARWDKEDELFKEFYSYIGENLKWWWD